MATLKGKYNLNEWTDGRIRDSIGCPNWCLHYTVKYIDVYDTTLSRDIQIAYEGCGSQNYVITLSDNDVKTVYIVPQTMYLSEALKSIGCVFQFCTHHYHRINGVLARNSCQPEVHIINYENKSKDDAFNKREEELALKEDALNKREQSLELAIYTLYKSIQKREEELALKEDAFNKREEEDLQRICETYN